MTTATEVRIVSATKEHIPFVAWVVWMANRSHLPRGMWDFVFEDDGVAIQRYLEVMADTERLHSGHYSLFLVAEVDGTPAAGLCGFLENDLPMETLIAAIAEADAKLGRTPEKVAAGWAKARSIANIATPHEPGAWVIENVACKPASRRRGLVERLIAAMLERGRELGAKTAEIGVLIGNDPAQRLYEKAGFGVVEEVRDAGFERDYGCPGAFGLRRSI